MELIAIASSKPNAIFLSKLHAKNKGHKMTPVACQQLEEMNQTQGRADFEYYISPQQIDVLI